MCNTDQLWIKGWIIGSNSMTTHITPGELAKVLGIRISEVPHKMNTYLRKPGPVGQISYEDALLLYIGHKLLKKVGLHGHVIRQICDWLRGWLQEEGYAVYEFDKEYNLQLFINTPSLKDDFDRKLKEVMGEKP